MNFVWQNSRVHGPDGDTSKVLPSTLTLLIALSEQQKRKHIAKNTCMACQTVTIVNGVCRTCGKLPVGPHSAWPREPPDRTRLFLVILAVLFVIAFIIIYAIGLEARYS